MKIAPRGPAANVMILWGGSKLHSGPQVEISRTAPHNPALHPQCRTGGGTGGSWRSIIRIWSCAGSSPASVSAGYLCDSNRMVRVGAGARRVREPRVFREALQQPAGITSQQVPLHAGRGLVIEATFFLFFTLVCCWSCSITRPTRGPSGSTIYVIHHSVDSSKHNTPSVSNTTHVASTSPPSEVPLLAACLARIFWAFPSCFSPI